jgi:hypothetical protein
VDIAPEIGSLLRDGFLLSDVILDYLPDHPRRRCGQYELPVWEDNENEVSLERPASFPFEQSIYRMLLTVRDDCTVQTVVGWKFAPVTL